MTLRMRLVLGYMLVVAASFFFAAHLIMSEVRPRYLEAVEESVVDTAELIAALLARQVSDGELHTENIGAAMAALSVRAFYAKIYDAEKEYVDLRIYITDKNGILIYDSTGDNPPGTDFSQWRDVYLTLRGRYGARSTRTDPGNPASSVIYVAAPIMKNGEIFGVATVGKPQGSVALFIDIAQKKLTLTLTLIALVATLVAAALSIWITRPINRLTAYVRSVRQGMNGPLPKLGPPEIAALGKAVGEMQNTLEGKNYIEDYVRALTHEMKSPLTGIKGAGEILRDHVRDADGKKFLDNIDNEVLRMQSLVERMLQLSRLENVRAITKTAIPATLFFDELGSAFQTRLEAKNVRLVREIPGELVLRGDRFLLRQAMENLLANALDFSPAGTAITLGVRQGPQGAVVVISDQGTGMPDFALEKAFDKFFSLPRPGSGKKSTGLGLPFVREVISLHGGTIRLRNTHPGLEITLTLPAA